MKNYNSKICAVIMTGGKSSRMGGGIKTLKKFNNKIIFDRIFSKINYQTPNIIINLNNLQKNFLKYNLPIVEDKLTGHLGPLAGIHASLIWIKKNMKNIKWLVSVPSDTPFIPKNLINKLYTKAIKLNKQIIMAKSNNRIHPVIAIWNINLLENLEIYLKNGERKIIIWAKNHNLEYEEFNEEQYDPFFNINYKEDLIKAKEIEEKYIIN